MQVTESNSLKTQTGLQIVNLGRGLRHCVETPTNSEQVESIVRHVH